MRTPAADALLASEIDSSTRLAYKRTRLALERTMQAWIRTATSLVTFGFSVYKFFQLETPANKQWYAFGPREFGESLVALGLAALIWATVDYRSNIRSLGGEYGGRQSSLAVGVACALSLIAATALTLMFLRM